MPLPPDELLDELPAEPLDEYEDEDELLLLDDDEALLWPLKLALDDELLSLSLSNLRANGLNCSISWQLAGPSTKGRSTR